MGCSIFTIRYHRHRALSFLFLITGYLSNLPQNYDHVFQRQRAPQRTDLVASSRSEGRESSSELPQPQMWPNCKAVRYTEKCDGTYVQLYLHTRRGSEAVEVTDDTNNITSTKFNDLWPNIIVVHGYNSDMTLDALVSIKNEYLKSGDYNIWAADFPRLVKNPCYPYAVYNVQYIARCISLLVKGIRAVSIEPHIHVVGFSLGAHVAGRIGYEVRDKKVDRVTGLDPALPLFFGSNPGERLSKSNANFVDVVHTNMFMQGHYSALGHVDFYMNGGTFQPGCTGGAERSGCDHHRAAIYFAESINSKSGFWGKRCSGLMQIMMNRCPDQPPYEQMGDHVSLSAQGQYYVKTGSDSPYAIGYPNRTAALKIVRRRS